MAFVTLTNIVVLDNPSSFYNPFQFEVTFECIQALEDDLEWKITYVGSAENESCDQVLEEVLVGPVPIGTNKFVFQANPPNAELIPEGDRIGVTVVLVTCSYKQQEFVRVGYYVNNDYTDPILLENPPEKVDMSKLQRNILADKPRVTRFPIEWSKGNLSKDSSVPTLLPTDENMAIETDYNLADAAASLDVEDDLIIGEEDDLFMEDEEELEDDEDMDTNIEIDL